MRVSISGHHYNVSDTTRVYIEEGVNKLERFYAPVIDCQVTLVSGK